MSDGPRLRLPAARRHTQPLRSVRSVTLDTIRHIARSAGRRAAPRVAGAMLLVALSPGGGPYAPAQANPAYAAPAGSAVRQPAASAPDLIRRRQWALDALRISRSWRYCRGDGVTVAVLDTGVDGAHPDLSGAVVNGPDFTGRTRRPGGRFWGRHGTAMASIIAGHGHGPGEEAGIVGVAPRAKILSVRVTLENEDPARRDKAQLDRSRDAVAKGIRYAVDNGAQVINMSLGGGTQFYAGNPAEEDAVKYALRQGAVLVASSGNDGDKLNRRTFPAAYPGVIAVGAVDRKMRATKFSNHHSYVSVAAPGEDIVMADAGRGYVVGTGTSPSAAYVAGIAALTRCRYPQLSPEQIRQAIEKGVTHPPPNGRDDHLGTGVVDAIRAIFAARDLDRRASATSSAPQATVAAPLTDSAPTERPNVTVIFVLIVGASVLSFGLCMLFMNLRRRARSEAFVEITGPAGMAETPAEWTGEDETEDGWADGGWPEESWPAQPDRVGGAARGDALVAGAPAASAAAPRESAGAGVGGVAGTPDAGAPAAPLAAPVNVAPVVSTDVYAGSIDAPVGTDGDRALPADAIADGGWPDGPDLPNGHGRRDGRRSSGYALAGGPDLPDGHDRPSGRSNGYALGGRDLPDASGLANGGGPPEGGVDGFPDTTGTLDAASLRPFDAAPAAMGAGPPAAADPWPPNGNGAAHNGNGNGVAYEDGMAYGTGTYDNGAPAGVEAAFDSGAAARPWTARDNGLGDAAPYGNGLDHEPGTNGNGHEPGPEPAIPEGSGLDDLPRPRTPGDRGVDATRGVEPLPAADPAARDNIGTPIAEQIWQSLRNSRSRAVGHAAGQDRQTPVPSRSTQSRSAESPRAKPRTAEPAAPATAAGGGETEALPRVSPRGEDADRQPGGDPGDGPDHR